MFERGGRRVTGGSGSGSGWGCTGWMRLTVSLALAVLLGAVPLGCAKQRPPAPFAGFIENPEQMAPRPERFPFDLVWINPDSPPRSAKYVLVRRVDVDHLLGIDWTKEQPTTEESGQARLEANGLARRLWESMRSAFYYDPNRRLTVVDRPREETAVLELAIVRVVLDKFGQGTVAMEGRIRDAETNVLLATFKDTESGNRKKIVDQWALWLVELVNTPASYKVGDKPVPDEATPDEMEPEPDALDAAEPQAPPEESGMLEEPGTVEEESGRPCRARTKWQKKQCD